METVSSYPQTKVRMKSFLNQLNKIYGALPSLGDLSLYFERSLTLTLNESNTKISLPLNQRQIHSFNDGKTIA